MPRIPRIILPIAVCALLLPGWLRAEAPKVIERKDNAGVVLLVADTLLCPITVTLKAQGRNMHSSAALPITTVAAAGVDTRLALLSAENKGQPWRYEWTWHWREGSLDARHNDAVIYELPYAPGDRHEVSQGFHGKFSHHGAEEYAIDWHMPVGSIVRATRAGRVIALRMDSTEGGNDLARFGDKANYVHVLHDDGTIGVYMHLDTNGALVGLGDAVKAGTSIARSGNTGFSTQPHLHFHVMIPNDGNTFHTVPIKFHTRDAAAAELVQGTVYEAP